MDCGFFEGNETDKFAYKTFITKFKNSLDLQGNLNDALKLHCLKNKLKGYAYSIIQNLSSKEDNYSKALEILDKEFLDEKHIKDEIYKKIIALRPNFDPSYNATRVYLNEIKSLIYELESYNLKFLEKIAGLELLSHIVLSKLPNIVVKEITRKLDTNYPDLNQIFDSYNEILKNLVKTSNQNQVKPNPPKVPYSGFKSNASKGPNYKSNNRPESQSSLQNFKTTGDEASQDIDSSASNFKNYSKSCKFCASQEHVMRDCNMYENYESRVRRSKEINLCYRCSSSKHGADQCPGLDDRLSFSCQTCSQNTHITALCKHRKGHTLANVCLSYNQCTNNLYLLPSITIKVGRGKNSTLIRCLLDSGSQRSYISKKVLDKLNYSLNNHQSTQYNIQTYLGISTRNLKETVLDVYFDQVSYTLLVLIDEDLQLNYEVNS